MKLLAFLWTLNILVNVGFIQIICSALSSTPAPTTPWRRQNESVFGTKLFLTPPTKSSAVPNSTRTIQRLVGGHILHYTERPKTLNFYFRRKSPTSVVSTKLYSTNTEKVDDVNDDVVLLNDNKIDWEPELIQSSAGDGKETPAPAKKEESKKTLSDQVKDGKYGLIEKELFSEPPKRPGILSYTINAETSKDTPENLGGLESDDIWLAEDHLLVLKGGGLNERDRQEPWKPIDDYDAPLRQVKIPDNPKVPPPFPVQLEENGPIQFVGNNQFPFFNPFANESIYFGEGAQKENPYGPNPANIPAGFRPLENSTEFNGYQYPPPIPPWLFNNETFKNPPVNGFPFPSGPGFPPNGSFPSGPGGNFTEPFDEDDPSFFYPPPYSFVYKSNYTNPVSPGPLVPGIVLPPPPNFFSRLKEGSSNTPQVSRILSKPRQKLIPVTKIVTTLAPSRPPITPSTTTSTTQRPTTSTTPVYIKEIIPDNRNRYYVRNHVQKLRPTTVLPPTRTPVTIPVKLSKVVTPSSISFVPQISPQNNVFKQGNPIYYEYFDARQPNNNQIITNNPIETITEIKSTTPYPIYNDITPVYQEENTPENTYLPPKSFDYSKYYYVTPQPDIQPNGVPNNYIPANYNDNLSFKPLKSSFDDEVETIRQTLKYYKSSGAAQDLYQTPQPTRTAKAKPVYQYDYQQDNVAVAKNNFSQNIELDSTPFKPIVQYSSPYNDNNGFKAMQAYPKTDSPVQYYDNSQKYSQSNNQPQYTSVVRTKGGKSNNRFFQPQQIYRSSTDKPIQYYLPNEEVTASYYAAGPTQSTTIKSTPWIKIEKQKVVELSPQSEVPQRVYLRNHDTYQQYPNSPQQYYPNNQFTKQVSIIRNKIRNQQHPQHYQPSLINDTYVNYVRPQPINPDAEYITIQPAQEQQYIPSQPIVNVNNYNNYQQNQQQIPAPIPLHKDINVNYNYPLPQINPDAEYIQPQISSAQYQKLNQYRNPLSQQYKQINQHQQQQQQYQRQQNQQYQQYQQRSEQQHQQLQQHQQQQHQQQQHQQQQHQHQQHQQQQHQQQQHQQQQNFKQYAAEQQQPVVQYSLPGDRDAHVYFYTPREQKSSRGQGYQ